jgi:hypothetical protein
MNGTQHRPVTTLRSLASLAAMLLTACALSPSTPTSPTTPITQCFEGPGQITLPGGAVFPSEHLVASRTLRPQEGLIEETVASFGLRPAEPPRIFEVRLRVSADRFSMRSLDGSFEGEGVLEGPAWGWTRWRSQARFPDGASVASENRLEGQVRHGRKRGYAPDGTLQWTIEETLAQVPLSRCVDQLGAARTALSTHTAAPTGE